MTQVAAKLGAGQDVGDNPKVDDVCTRPNAERLMHRSEANPGGRLGAWLCERLIGAVCRGVDLAVDCAKRGARRARIAAALYDRPNSDPPPPSSKGKSLHAGVIDLDDYKRTKLRPAGRSVMHQPHR